MSCSSGFAMPFDRLTLRQAQGEDISKLLMLSLSKHQIVKMIPASSSACDALRHACIAGNAIMRSI
jgi:hypothetical protein